MDKIAQKMILASAKIPQVRSSIDCQLSTLRYPLFVKPANGGSSIGVTKVKSASSLKDAIEVAKCYDRRVVIEESAEGYKEINISVLGNAGDKLMTSVCEQPVPSKEVLTYQDKYQSENGKSAGMASARRLIPAPIKPVTAAKIAQYAKDAFNAIDGAGMARIDFLVSPDEKTIYLNEINPMPGSLAFYLWEKTGLPFSKLLDELITLAQQRFSEKSQKTYTFSSSILANLGNTLKNGKLKG
jgi:D-alanine-D-alanine ligase